MNPPSLVILTGAGISAESGIKTFRDQNGLWEGHAVEDVASIQGFRTNPDVVQAFYNQRRAQLLEDRIKPNAAHIALAKLEKEWKGEFLLITQNVDDLHERAGSRRLIHMHGELLKVRCNNTYQIYNWETDILPNTQCNCCRQTGTLRPHIVWFGEMPFEMNRISNALSQTDIFISIGTSALVYPAAGFVEQVPPNARTIEINLESTEKSPSFKECRSGAASTLVPQLVINLLSYPSDWDG